MGNHENLENNRCAHGEHTEQEELEKLSIEELYRMLVRSSYISCGGNTMEAIVIREAKRSKEIANVLRKKIINELDRYANELGWYANDNAETYKDLSIDELIDKLSWAQHLMQLKCSF